MDTQYVQCDWSMDDQDACPFCSGEICNKCGAGAGYTEVPCEHDSLERHKEHERLFGGDEH